MTQPRTLPEWEAYIRKLAGEPLRSKLIAVNSQDFYKAMLDEGIPAPDIMGIITMFVRQAKACGMKLPGGGAFDLDALAREDAASGHKVVEMDERQVDAMAASPPDEGQDDIDQFLNERELEADWGEA